MRDASDQYTLLEQEPNVFGYDWVHTLSECSYPEQTYDYNSVRKFGITPDQIISYLTVEQSTQENILANAIALSELDPSTTFTINNKIDRFTDEMLETQCQGDIYCATYFNLCFTISSEILDCDT